MPARRSLRTVGLAPIEAARLGMVDRPGWYGQDGCSSEQGEDRDQVEHGALGKPPADGAGKNSDRHVAGVVEGGVSSHAVGKAMRSENAERDRRDGWTEDR